MLEIQISPEAVPGANVLLAQRLMRLLARSQRRRVTATSGSCSAPATQPGWPAVDGGAPPAALLAWVRPLG